MTPKHYLISINTDLEMDEKGKKERKEMNAGFKPNYFRVLCHPMRKG